MHEIIDCICMYYWNTTGLESYCYHPGTHIRDITNTVVVLSQYDRTKTQLITEYNNISYYCNTRQYGDWFFTYHVAMIQYHTIIFLY